MAAPAVPLGVIATTHGLNGWLKLNPYNPGTAVLAAGRQVHLVRGDACADLQLAADAKSIKNQFLIKLEGIDRIDEAQCWVGAILSIDESALAPLEPGQYYHYQVIGFQVLDNYGRRIGIIASVLSTPGNDILVVKEAEKEFLIPAVKEIVNKVDFAASRVIVDLPEGLLDL